MINIQDGQTFLWESWTWTWAVRLRRISLLVPNLVEFSSHDLKVLIVPAFMTSCDKWFQFCSTRWLKEKRKVWTGKASSAWTQNFLRQLPCSKQARAESCDQHGHKSTKSIGNQPSRVVKSSTSRSTKQPSRSLRSTRSTTGSNTKKQNRGSVLWCHCDMLRNSRFVHDMFAHNGAN